MIRFLFLLLALSSHTVLAQTSYITQSDITVGSAQFERYSELLVGKRVAITGNHTSMIGQEHVVDFLLEKSVNLTKVFAPEHGFRGKADAGEKVESGKDAKTGLPIVSLYGSHKKPTADDLSGVDIMLFDIQDVGARFYTYISTMTYVMEACAENNIPVVILDRPNPHGFYIDGPMLKPEHESFVGMLEIPVIHGMTVGELAQMINGEKWLKNDVQCDLTVIPVKDYDHKQIYVLPVAPSPNLPSQNAIMLYPSLCFFEGTDVSVGRGTDKPFEIFGHPNFKQGSFMFVPKPTIGAKHPKHEGVPCAGWDLSEFGGKRIQETEGLILDWLVNAYRDFPNQDKFFLRNGFFENLAGTDLLRKQIQQGFTADQIRASWAKDLGDFNAKRKKYLLYKDFD